MNYRAIAYDTGGTVLDWHDTLVDELAVAVLGSPVRSASSG
jgi:hypothetical protein